MWVGRGELRTVNGGAGPLVAKPASVGTTDTGAKDLGSWQRKALVVCGAGALDSLGLVPRRTLCGPELGPGDRGQPGWVVRAPLEATLQSSKDSSFSPLHPRSLHPITPSLDPWCSCTLSDHGDRYFLSAEGRNVLVYSLVCAGLQ